MLKKIYQGSSKTLYSSELDHSLIMSFEDSMRVSNGDIINISGKGSINNTISAHLMSKLNMIGIENHLIEKKNMKKQLVQYAEVYPVQLNITTIACGRYVSAFDIENGFVFESPIIDFTVKNSKLGYPPVNEQQILSFGWMSKEELKELQQLGMRVHDFLVGLFAAINIRMVDIKLEFGRVFNGEDFVPMLVDEISPDTCRLWDMDSNQKLCYEIADQGEDRLIAAYQEVLSRLC